MKRIPLIILAAASVSACVTGQHKLTAITRAAPPPPTLNESIPLGNGMTLTRQTANPAYTSYMQALASIKTSEDHASDLGRTAISATIPVVGQVLLNRDSQAAGVERSAIGATTERAMWGAINNLGLQGNHYDQSDNSDNSNQHNATAPAEWMPGELLREPVIVPQPQPVIVDPVIVPQPQPVIVDPSVVNPVVVDPVIVQPQP